MIGTIASLLAGAVGAGMSAYRNHQAHKQLAGQLSTARSKMAGLGNGVLGVSGQAAMTNMKEGLQDSTAGLAGSAAVNGGGLNAAKAANAYSKSLGAGVSQLYQNDYAQQMKRLSELEGTEEKMNTAIAGMRSKQAEESAKAAGQALSGAVQDGTTSFWEDWENFKKSLNSK